MSKIARTLHTLRRSKKTITSIGILYMSNLTDSEDKVQRYVSKNTGMPLRIDVEFNQRINVYAL